MDNKAFRLLHEAEGTWWYKGRSLAVARTLSDVPVGQGFTVLDMGAGYGGMCAPLSQYGKVYGIELDAGARAVALTRGYQNVFATLEELEKSDIQFDLIAVLDVLEHVEDDIGLLSKLLSLLSPKGTIVLTVPAYPILWSEHDVSHHHHRRYKRKVLAEACSMAGGRLTYVSHWNVVLFPVALAMRLFGKSGESSFSPGSFVDRVLFYIIRLETMFIPWASFPFGVSIVARIARDS